jgi:hypothetical protein
MTDPSFHHLGLHANQLGRNIGNERMQMILQWVGVGSVIMMGLASTVHLIKDCMKPSKEAHHERHRELRDRLNEHDRGR